MKQVDDSLVEKIFTRRTQKSRGEKCHS
uniref:Uncharacterized protein n=1 Tax=Anguilla anguilla TaxID=7936 RepID=A0A0E9PH61_ANGAN